MVDSIWLNAHREEDIASKLADSGIHWGDAENPEDVESRLARNASDKKAEAAKRKAERSDGVEAAKKVKMEDVKGKGKVEAKAEEESRGVDPIGQAASGSAMV